MKKKSFFNSRIIALVLVLFLLALMFCGIGCYIFELVEGADTVDWFNFISLCLGMFIGIAILCGSVLEFVVIDEKTIIAKNAFHKTCVWNWQDVIEVRLLVPNSNKLPREITFVKRIPDLADEEVDDMDYLILKYSKKREQIIKKLKPDLELISEEDKLDEITEEK